MAVVLVVGGLFLVPATGLASPRTLVGGRLGLGLGFGLTGETDPVGFGLHMEGSYTYAPWVLTKWYSATPVELTGYTGMFWIWTTDANGCKRATTGDDCEVSAQIGYLGGRARFTLPIPWFGPYIESGIGLSLGRLRTALDSSDHRVDGAALHVPFGLGVQLGPEHQVEVGLFYLFHPKARQTDGSLGIGLSCTIP